MPRLPTDPTAPPYSEQTPIPPFPPVVSIILRKISLFLFLLGLAPFLIHAAGTHSFFPGLGVLPIAASSYVALRVLRDNKSLSSPSKKPLTPKRIFQVDITLLFVYIPFWYWTWMGVWTTLSYRYATSTEALLAMYCGILVPINVFAHFICILGYWIQHERRNAECKTCGCHQVPDVNAYHDNLVDQV